MNQILLLILAILELALATAAANAAKAKESSSSADLLNQLRAERKQELAQVKFERLLQSANCPNGKPVRSYFNFDISNTIVGQPSYLENQVQGVNDFLNAVQPTEVSFAAFANGGQLLLNRAPFDANAQSTINGAAAMGEAHTLGYGTQPEKGMAVLANSWHCTADPQYLDLFVTVTDGDVNTGSISKTITAYNAMNSCTQVIRACAIVGATDGVDNSFTAMADTLCGASNVVRIPNQDIGQFAQKLLDHFISILCPSSAPTIATSVPTVQPTTSNPTSSSPTSKPSFRPSYAPTFVGQTYSPSIANTTAPSFAPSFAPTANRNTTEESNFCKGWNGLLCAPFARTRELPGAQNAIGGLGLGIAAAAAAATAAAATAAANEEQPVYSHPNNIQNYEEEDGAVELTNPNVAASKVNDTATPNQYGWGWAAMTAHVYGAPKVQKQEVDRIKTQRRPKPPVNPPTPVEPAKDRHWFGSWLPLEVLAISYHGAVILWTMYHEEQAKHAKRKQASNMWHIPLPKEWYIPCESNLTVLARAADKHVLTPAYTKANETCKKCSSNTTTPAANGSAQHDVELESAENHVGVTQPRAVAASSVNTTQPLMFASQQKQPLYAEDGTLIPPPGLPSRSQNPVLLSEIRSANNTFNAAV